MSHPDLAGLALGRIVHVTIDESLVSQLVPAATSAKLQRRVMPAIITRVQNSENGAVDLTVFPAHDDGLPPALMLHEIVFARESTPGYWHWPNPRVNHVDGSHVMHEQEAAAADPNAATQVAGTAAAASTPADVSGPVGTTVTDDIKP